MPSRHSRKSATASDLHGDPNEITKKQDFQCPVFVSDQAPVIIPVSDKSGRSVHLFLLASGFVQVKPYAVDQRKGSEYDRPHIQR